MDGKLCSSGEGGTDVKDLPVCACVCGSAHDCGCVVDGSNAMVALAYEYYYYLYTCHNTCMKIYLIKKAHDGKPFCHSILALAMYDIHTTQYNTAQPRKCQQHDGAAS